MKNIISTQLYQLKKDKTLFITILAAAVVLFVSVYQMIYIQGDYFTFNGSYCATEAFYYAFLDSVIILIVVGYVMGKDFSDDTINYEILYGYNRKASFWGRSIVAMVLGTLTSVIFIVASIGVISIKYGWGSYVSVKGFALRLLLFAVLAWRLCCEVILVSIVVKKIYITYIVGAIVGLLEMAATSNPEFPNISFFMSAMEFFNYEVTGSSHIDGSFDIKVIDKIDVSNTAVILAISLVIGVFCLMAAMSFFKSDDI